MKTHTKPDLRPGQIVYFITGENAVIVQTRVSFSVTGHNYTEYHLSGYMGVFHRSRLHTTFNSAKAALKAT